MARFNLSITAHVNKNDKGNTDAVMTLYEKDFSENIMVRRACPHVGPVLDRLMTLMPCIDWQPDDGDDELGVTYCQYAAYENGDPKTGNYLLGAWCEINEETGTMK